MGQAGHWWRTWSASGSAAPTLSSPLRWGTLVCNHLEWWSLVSWAPGWWRRPWSSRVLCWAGGCNWRGWWRQGQSSGAVWKSRWPSWGPIPNNPTVSVDIKQHFNNFNTGASWSLQHRAQCFKVEEETLSGPAALQLFCFLKSCLTLHSSMMKGDGRAEKLWQECRWSNRA